MNVIDVVGQAQLQYDASHKIIKMYFNGNMPDDEYKLLWTKSIDYAEKHQINRVIIDQQEIGDISFNARCWVVLNAFPRIKEAFPSGMVVAVLSSEKVVQKAGMQYLQKAFRALTGYRVEVFSSQQEAVNFLLSAIKPADSAE